MNVSNNIVDSALLSKQTNKQKLLIMMNTKKEITAVRFGSHLSQNEEKESSSVRAELSPATQHKLVAEHYKPCSSAQYRLRYSPDAPVSDPASVMDYAMRQLNTGQRQAPVAMPPALSQPSLNMTSPRSTRKRSRLVYGDDMACEVRALRRSKRLKKKNDLPETEVSPHLGDHSYTPVSTTDRPLGEYADISVLDSGPGFLEQWGGLMRNFGPGFHIHANATHYAVDTDIYSRGKMWGNSTHEVVVENVGATKAPGVPFQYTRMVWGNSYVLETIPIKQFVEVSETSGQINPRDLSTKIGAIAQFPRLGFEAIANVVGTQQQVYDNVALYTKSLFYGLLMARMQEQQIPLFVPDLIQAPVTYLLLSSNPEQAIEVIRMIDLYTRRGWFVLAEGRDFERHQMVALHMLALGGASMAPNVGDHSIAAQSIRWPAIRFLVLCNNNLPIYPVGEQPLPNDMRSLAVHFAKHRGEQDVLGRAWYQATYLVGCEWIQRFPDAYLDVNAVAALELNGDDNALDPDDPLEIAGAGDNVGPGLHNMWRDGFGGEQGGEQQDNYAPLHIPNPGDVIAAVNARAMLLWEGRRADWAAFRGEYQLPPDQRGEPQDPRNPDEFPEPQPIAVQAAVGTVRGNRRLGGVWVNVLRNRRARQVGAHYPNPADHPWQYAAAGQVEFFRARNNMRAITPFLECNAMLQMPAPVDHCVFWRWLGYRRAISSSPLMPENSVLYSDMSMVQLGRLTAWAAAHLSVATSTSLFNWNITGSVLQRTLNRTFVSYFCTNLLLEGKYILRTSDDSLAGQPMLAFVVRLYVGSVFGAQLPADILSCRDWACYGLKAAESPVNYLPNLGAAVTPVLHNPLAILRWLKAIPIEWGLSGPGMTVDLSHDFVIISAVDANRGWFAENGSGEYRARTTSSAPYSIVVYGIQVANYILSNAHDRDEPIVPQPFVRHYRCAPSTPFYPEGVPQAPVADSWTGIGNLAVYNPLRTPSYEWDTFEVVVPAINDQTEFEIQEVMRLKHISGVVNDLGIEWNKTMAQDVPTYPTTNPTSQLFNAFFNLARPSRVGETVGRDSHKAEQPTQAQKSVEVGQKLGDMNKELPLGGLSLNTAGGSAPALEPGAQ